MSKIYKNFEELVKKNQGLFSFLNPKEQKNFNGIMKAIWTARQIEVDLLKEQLEEAIQDAQDKIKLEEDLKNTAQLLSSSAVEFSDELYNKEEKIEDLNLQIKELQNSLLKLNDELKRKEGLSLSLEKGLKLNQIQLTSEVDEKLSDSRKFDEQILELKTLKEEIKNLKKDNRKLSKELKESKAFTKQYKNLNNKMANELNRVNEKLNQTDQLQLN